MVRGSMKGKSVTHLEDSVINDKREVPIKDREGYDTHKTERGKGGKRYERRCGGGRCIY